MVTTPAQVIDDKGGPMAFAEAVGAPRNRVGLWKHRNKFPRQAWPEIQRAFPDLTLEKLLEIEKATPLKAAA